MISKYNDRDKLELTFNPISLFTLITMEATHVMYHGYINSCMEFKSSAYLDQSFKSQNELNPCHANLTTTGFRYNEPTWEAQMVRTWKIIQNFPQYHTSLFT